MTDNTTPAVRHHPAGRGHAYRPSLDQRVPVHPTSTDRIEVRALVADHAGPARLEHTVDGGPASTTPMRRLGGPDADGEDGEDGDAGGDGGHLAAAASAGEQVEGMHPVAATIPAQPAGASIRYRITTGQAATGWSEVVVAAWDDAPDGTIGLDGQAADRLLPGSVQQLAAGGRVLRVRFAVRLDDNEHVLGLGERFHALDHRGLRIDTQVFEQYKQQDRRTYLPVPFALVAGGRQAWGLHVATTRRCWWDIGATTPDQLIVEVDVDTDDPTVTAGTWAGTPAEVIEGFTGATGRPAPVPDWVFGPWASGNEWNTQARVEAEMARSRQEGIDVGVLVIEAWADEATFTAWRDATYTPRPDGGPMTLDDFTFPADGAWPDPKGMVDRLHQHGTRVLLWQIPVLPTDVPHDRLGAVQLAHDRDVLVERGMAVREADGSPYHNRGWWFPGALLPDFTSPEARDWWTAKRRYLIDEIGIDGFKTDGGEHPWGHDLRYADGTRGAQTNNRYPNLYAQTYHQLLTDTGTDGITFSRAGWTGAGTTPCHWAGDEDSTWHAYRASILAGLSAGISGIAAWGWDHGGFSGEIPDPELYLRTAAQAMLSPIMQYHSEYNHHRQPSRDRTPWNIAERHDTPDVIDTYRRFTRIRAQLRPYLVEQQQHAERTGMPMMRTLALHWPQHDPVWAHPYQYMLGHHLLVAPVTEPDVDQLQVWLPPGDWTDLWTGEHHHGDTTVNVTAHLDHIPAFTTHDDPGHALHASIAEAT